jgi:hypothetical protein
LIWFIWFVLFIGEFRSIKQSTSTN